MAAMDARFCRAIQSCFTLIVKNVEVEEIAGHLYECHLINIGHLEQLLLESLTRTKKCYILGLALSTTVCTQKRFEDLLSVLRPDYEYIAAQLQHHVENASLKVIDHFPHNDAASGPQYPTKLEQVEGLVNDVTAMARVTDYKDLNLEFDESISDREVAFDEEKRSDCCCFKNKKYCISQSRVNSMSIPGLLPPCNHGFKFSSSFHQKMFNELAALVSSRDLLLFSNRLHEFDCHRRVDPDAACIALYLKASCSVMNLDVEKSNQIIQRGLLITATTKTPVRFTVKLLSLRVWNDLNSEKPPSDLGQIKQLIHQDPLSCHGMVTAWNYVNEAKSCMLQIQSSSTHDSGRVAQLLDRAVVSYRCALQHFSIDKTYDGPYGFNYAALKLVSTLLACDDKLYLLKHQEEFYQPNNLPEARRLLSVVDESEEGVAKTLESLSFIARADYMFRANRCKRACQLAEWAKQSAIASHLNREKICAEIRCELYSSLVNKAIYSSSGCSSAADSNRSSIMVGKNFHAPSSSLKARSKQHFSSCSFVLISLFVAFLAFLFLFDLGRVRNCRQ